MLDLQEGRLTLVVGLQSLVEIVVLYVGAGVAQTADVLVCVEVLRVDLPLPLVAFSPAYLLTNQMDNIQRLQGGEAP